MRIIDLGTTEVVGALALEESLLESVGRGEGEAAWVLWTSRDKAIVLGTARPSESDILLGSAREDGVAMLRRRSGGGTVVLGPGSPAVTLIDVLAGDIRECYAHFCEVLSATLGRLGLGAEFRAPADLAVGELKVAGLAQRRKKRAALVTASVLVESMSDAAGRYLALPAGKDSPDYRRGRNHKEFMSSLVELGAVSSRAAFFAALGSELASRGAAAGAPSGAELSRADEIAPELVDPEWIGRF